MKKTYALINITTKEVYGKVMTETLAAAQEYFNIMFPIKSELPWVGLFEITE